MAIYHKSLQCYILVSNNSQAFYWVITMPLTQQIRITGFIFTLLTLFLPIRAALAGGYAIPPQTAKALGLANAVTAGVDDPSAVYANPAALTEVKGNQMMGGLNYIHTLSSVTNGGRRSDNVHDDSFIPTFFGNYHIPTTDFTAGIGLYAPFGLATSYDEDEFTRYGAIRSELKTLYLTPAMAWRANPSLSIGGGLSFVHSSALFSRALFSGAGVADGRLRLTDTDDTFTFNLGVLFKPNESLKFGFSYRGRADLNFNTGNVKVTDSTGAISTARSKGTNIPLPPVISAGMQWNISPKWKTEFVYDYTRWSEFPHLKASFNPVLLGGALGGLFIQELWKNTNTFRLGTSYLLSETVELRGGVILDETPIPGRTLGPSIPGADLLALNGGIGYNWKALTVNLGYMAVFYKTRKVLNTVLEADNTANTIAPGRDKYRTFQNFISLNLRYRF